MAMARNGIAQRGNFIRSASRLIETARLASTIILPYGCAGCGSGLMEPGLCPPCLAQLVRITAPCCARCSHPFVFNPGAPASSLLCGACLSAPPAFDHAVAALVYNDASRQMIVRLKHQDRLELAIVLARLMLPPAMPLLERADFIIPLPLHRWRFFLRRSNQSAELARALIRLAGLPSSRLQPAALIRHRNTARQAGLNRQQRQRNMRNAFHVPEAARTLVRDSRILLIDDVLTTGATLSSASRCLQRAGAAEVMVAVVARVC